jgi:hypothetical protein
MPFASQTPVVQFVTKFLRPREGKGRLSGDRWSRHGPTPLGESIGRVRPFAAYAAIRAC